MIHKSKEETFIGFILRTKRYKIGYNAVQTLKRAYLIILCKSASENSKKEAKSFSNKFHCPLLIAEQKTLQELTGKENAKIMAVTDKDLSKALIEAKGEILVENI